MIRSTGLSFQYSGAASALVFPDVDVAQGGVLVLRGLSGSGKSTWLALVAGLMQAKGGALWVAEQKLADLGAASSDAWRARTVGFLPQGLHLSAALTVTDNLRMAQWAAGVDDDPARAVQVLQALGIAALGGRRPAQLSGGQAQRAALARAVLLAPQVLLTDEPTASLDDEAAQESMRLLTTTASAHGATLVIATHDRRVTEYLDASPQAYQLLTLEQGASAGAVA